LREDIELGYKMGTDQYIKKPFDSTQLMTSVNRLLGLPDTPPSQPIASS